MAVVCHFDYVRQQLLLFRETSTKTVGELTKLKSQLLRKGVFGSNLIIKLGIDGGNGGTSRVYDVLRFLNI